MNKKLNKIINELLIIAQENKQQWRFGQTVFNYFLSVFPNVTNLARGSKFDCFFVDETVPEFISFIKNNIFLTSTPIYKVDSKNKLRFIIYEIDKNKYRTISGVIDGKNTISKWTVTEAKNVGKSNEVSAERQTEKEVISKYNKKLETGYYFTIVDAENKENDFFEPMLANSWEKVNDKYKVFPLIADPKLDGMRMTIGSDLKPISRKGKPILTADHIVNELKDFFIEYPDIVLDGELYSHDYKEDFNTLMSIARQIKPTEEDLKLARKTLKFHVYDVYFTKNTDSTAHVRKVWLMNNLASYVNNKDSIKFNIFVVPFTIVNNQQELDIVKEQNLLNGYEGTITRGLHSIYENKRSNWLLKHKDFITEEFEVIDIVEGKGNRSGIAGNIVIRYKETTVDPGIRGIFEYAQELLENKDNYIGKLATIRHFGETPDGSLRFPVCIDINRPDL